MPAIPPGSPQGPSASKAGLNDGVAEKTDEVQNLEAMRAMFLGSAAPCLWAETLRRVIAE
jgi:hypothetical protein